MSVPRSDYGQYTTSQMSGSGSYISTDLHRVSLNVDVEWAGKNDGESSIPGCLFLLSRAALTLWIDGRDSAFESMTFSIINI